MATNIYVDLATGNDTTGDGSNTLPYLTINKGVSVAIDGDTIRVGKTTAASTISISNSTWTNNSTSISTVSTHVGTIAVGDYIGKTTAAGNGALETFWRVNGVTATTITLESRYHGTTETVASFKKVVPTTTGSAGAIAATISKAITVSGGWTLGTQVQDGETWMKSNNLRTVDIGGILTNVTGVTIDKMNVIETGRCFRITGNGNTITNCSYGGASIYAFEVTGTGTVLTNLRGTGTLSASYYTLYLAPLASPTTMSDVKLSGIAGAQLPSVTAARATFTGIEAYNCSTAGITMASGANLDGATAEGCVTGILFTNNSRVLNCTITGATTGLSFSSVQGAVVDGCSISTCTTGANFVTSYGHLIKNCTFTNNTTDVLGDQYSHHNTFISNDHVTPVNWAYTKSSTNGGPWYLFECTIDVPSQAKAFQQIANSNYITPQWILQNSFGGLYGSYYANGQVTRDTTTTPYSVKVQFNSSGVTSMAEYKMGSCYAKEGVAKTVSYKIKATGAWSGTIIPMLAINGATIVTGSAITSVSTGSFDTHTISATALEIDRDGEMALVFQYSGNTNAINLKEFSVTDT